MRESRNSTWIAAIVITAGLTAFIGFAIGLLMTRPNREKAKSAIASAQAKAKEVQIIAQQKITAVELETELLRNKLNRLSAELKTKTINTFNLQSELDILKQKKDRQSRDEKHIAKVEPLNKEILQGWSISPKDSIEAGELWWNENFNHLEILSKLEIFAIERNTTDTSEYHNHINKLEENHRIRLNTIKLWGELQWLQAPFFEELLDVQKRMHQYRLECIKLNSIEAFDMAEKIEQNYYEKLIKATNNIIEKEKIRK